MFDTNKDVFVTDMNPFQSRCCKVKAVLRLHFHHQNKQRVESDTSWQVKTVRRFMNNILTTLHDCDGNYRDIKQTKSPLEQNVQFILEMSNDKM